MEKNLVIAFITLFFLLIVLPLLIRKLSEKKIQKKWFAELQAEAQKIGAELYLIPKLRVNGSKSWKEAVMEGGPNTGSDYIVLNVEDKYEPLENKIYEETIVLLIWPKGGGNKEKAVEFALKNNLEKSIPREIFAIRKKIPALNYIINPNPLYVVETTGFLFRGVESICNVNWNNTDCEVDFGSSSSFVGENIWFAFRKSKNVGSKVLDVLSFF